MTKNGSFNITSNSTDSIIIKTAVNILFIKLHYNKFALKSHKDEKIQNRKY